MGTMQTLYKLTDQNDETYNNTKWGKGVAHAAPGQGRLCTNHWLHAYTDPNLAVLLNPIHADIEHPRLWLAEGLVGATDYGLKVGCTYLRTIQRIPAPKITPAQKTAFAILCALEVLLNQEFIFWANNWLSGADRSKESADKRWGGAETYIEDSVAAAASLAAADGARKVEILAGRVARVARECAHTPGFKGDALAILAAKAIKEY